MYFQFYIHHQSVQSENVHALFNVCGSLGHWILEGGEDVLDVLLLL